MDGKQALRRLEKQYKRQNEYIKNSYDRISVTLPKGTKDRIKAAGYSVNGLINELVADWLQEQEPENRQYNIPAAEDPEEMPFN